MGGCLERDQQEEAMDRHSIQIFVAEPSGIRPCSLSAEERDESLRFTRSECSSRRLLSSLPVHSPLQAALAERRLAEVPQVAEGRQV
ncbi:MAG TPA: hypothetical protein DCG12_06570, partial [Planctomycetaceae bacterium]|nr:hypothetical protein [Planctomycetaceae bacterium]